ncbi:hypothetical protein HPB48_019932 [Haemaphysalis longicornis]|uniref:Cullin family profile domain-containing protein n=1 Tax=Haemaphysalis longicornis TaxID=44386 RepID=A0A9J6FWX6_HAELO|nr:hypothetical protein HPB48_019932 [Haemaphysalis longicornis]
MRSYMHNSTLQPLLKICDNIFIENHIDILHSKLQELPRKEKEADRWTHAESRVSRARRPRLASTFVFVQRARPNAGFPSDTASRRRRQGPDFLRDHSAPHAPQVQGSGAQHLRNGRRLCHAMSTACEKFVNSNAAPSVTNSYLRSPEPLAKYCSLMPKTSPNTDAPDLESALKQAITVFRGLHGKDSFEKSYSKKMSKRLMYKISVSDEAMESMFLKLKEAYGFAFTARLRRMFQDIVLSEGLNQA